MEQPVPGPHKTHGKPSVPETIPELQQMRAFPTGRDPHSEQTTFSRVIKSSRSPGVRIPVTTGAVDRGVTGQRASGMGGNRCCVGAAMRDGYSRIFWRSMTRAKGEASNRPATAPSSSSASTCRHNGQGTVSRGGNKPTDPADCTDPAHSTDSAHSDDPAHSVDPADSDDPAHSADPDGVEVQRMSSFQEK